MNRKMAENIKQLSFSHLILGTVEQDIVINKMTNNFGFFGNDPKKVVNTTIQTIIKDALTTKQGKKQAETNSTITKQIVKKNQSFQIFDKVSKEQQKNANDNAKNGKKDITLIQKMTNNKPKEIIDPPKSLEQFQNLNKGTLSNLIKRKVQKSEYDELIEKYKNSKQLWTDKDFPPNKQSFGVFKPIDKPVIWKRISQVVPNAKFAQNHFSPQDILQKSIGNCYFLSVISGIAQKPHRIKNIFPSNEINKNGIYMARMMYGGVYQEVIVDDFIPINPNNGNFYGAAPAGGKEIWVMILEKCWSKLCGSYSDSEGGLPNEVMRPLTSAPTYTYRVPSNNKYNLWEEVLKADRMGYVICCGTKRQDSRTKQEWERLGLVGGHAYTILDAYDSPQRILKIRNPWGKREWRGEANERDLWFWSKIKEESKAIMDHHIDDDGIFFMLWRDFQKHFDLVEICKIKDNAHYIYYSQKFVKGLPIFYDIVSEGGEATFVASQKSKRQFQKLNKRPANATLILSKVSQKNTFQYIASNAGQRHSEVYLTVNLQKGKYVLCCYVQESLQNTVDSTISIYTESNTTFLKCQINEADFLNQVYLDYGQKNSIKQRLSNNPLDWQMNGWNKDSNFGFHIMNLNEKENKGLEYVFDQLWFDKNGLQLLPPFKNGGSVNGILRKGNQLIIICRIKPGLAEGLVSVPNPILKFVPA